MKIQRTLPPTAAPLSLLDFLCGIHGLINPDITKKFERELKEYFGSTHVFLVSSGKAALSLILSGLKTGNRRGKVVLPAYTCYSVPSAVRKAGLQIELCDIDPETLDYDYDELENVIDDNTLCVISTHLFGIPSDICRLRDIARDRGAFLVEDAAQAMGVTNERGKLGTLGDVGFFSLGRGKNITCGSGGIILTSSDEIAENINRYYKDLEQETIYEYLKNIAEVLLIKIFINPYLYWIPNSMPFLNIGITKFYTNFPVRRFNGFKAGLLHDWKKKLEYYNSIRINISKYYINNREIHSKLPLTNRSIPYLRFPIYESDKGKRDDICERYRFLGISQMYPASLNNCLEIKDNFRNRIFNKASRVADQLITLPTHALLNKKDMESICNALSKG